MGEIQKVCPLVIRGIESGTEVLAFAHPSAGKQFVKGTLEPGETPIDAARRELLEESGLTVHSPMTSLGQCEIGPDRQLWHFFGWQGLGLPDAWQHATTDDHGHRFAFFWHPLDASLDEDWHPIFHEAFDFFVPCLLRQTAMGACRQGSSPNVDPNGRHSD